MDKVYISGLLILVLALLIYGIPLLYGRRKVHLKGDKTYISFDDGPSEVTPQVLEVLDQAGVKATFFLLGEEIVKRPQLVKKMAEEGHQLGLHGYSHRHPLKMTFPSQYEDLKRGYKAFEDLGLKPAYYRAPHGAYTWASLYFCSKYHLKILHWTGLVGDWNLEEEDVLLGRLEALSGPGHLLVLHDGTKGTANPLAKTLVPQLLEDLNDALKGHPAPLGTWRRP